MMKMADELMARSKWERPMRLSTMGLDLHNLSSPVSLQLTTSYISGMIFTDWQRMNKIEMEIKTTWKEALKSLVALNAL